MPRLRNSKKRVTIFTQTFIAKSRDISSTTINTTSHNPLPQHAQTFSMFLPPSPVTQYHTFAPYSTQPLSPLNPNARAFYQSMSSSTPKLARTSIPNVCRTNPARRRSKFDTLTKETEEVHERRRGAFLRGVRERGEERRGMVRAELVC